jgi:hypothetical protein
MGGKDNDFDPSGFGILDDELGMHGRVGKFPGGKP